MADSLSAAALNIGVLVFREGLECILVLAAITAGMTGATRAYRKPVAAGAAIAMLATLVTWMIAVRAIDALSDNFSALQIQAATGLLAIGVLLIVMNWFFHKVYWTGWISLHTTRKQTLLTDAASRPSSSQRRLVLGLAMLGFTSLYREGVEVVLFLQTYRLQLGTTPIAIGASFGLFLTVVVAVFTFWLRRRLPYRKMLVLTGVMLGVVLLVMVGEQAQEMQLAHWLPTTTVPWLAVRIPDWTGVWLSIFPTIETIGAQAIALALVLGSYLVARRREAARRVDSVIKAPKPSTSAAWARSSPGGLLLLVFACATALSARAQPTTLKVDAALAHPAVQMALKAGNEVRVEGADILRHPIGILALQYLDLVHAGKMDDATLLATAAVQAKRKADPPSERAESLAYLKKNLPTRATVTAGLQGGAGFKGVLIITDDKTATLNLIRSEQHPDGSGQTTSSSTTTFIGFAKEGGKWRLAQ